MELNENKGIKILQNFYFLLFKCTIFKKRYGKFFQKPNCQFCSISDALNFLYKSLDQVGVDVEVPKCDDELLGDEAKDASDH